MKVIILSVWIISATAITCVAQNSAPGLVESKRVLLLMGTRFEIKAVAPTVHQAEIGIETGIKEVRRIENLISSWNPESQTSRINSNAGIRPVKVDQELYNLITRSLRISELTNGAFDISFASAGNLWKFDGSMTEPPPADAIRASVAKINYKNIIMNPADTSVFLSEKGMKIGFGGIGKGYAAERAKKVMQSGGIRHGVVNAAGDLTTWGKRKDGTSWNVGISRPDKSRQILGWLNADESSVVTSGNYEKFFIHKEIRYSHIIDPRTGYPTSGIKSATIVCTNAELADALATTMFVLGQQEGIALINQLNGIECLIITDEDKIITSNNLKISFEDVLQITGKLP